MSTRSPTPASLARWRATSIDGLHFTIDPAQPVLDEAGADRAPSAIAVDGTTYLYYEANGAIRVAASPDGRSFGASAAALSIGGMIIHDPGAVAVDGEVYVYYERADGSLGLAIGPPGGALTDRGAVLSPADVQVGAGTPGTAFWTPVTRLASPHAILAGPAGGQTIHLYFSGFGTESAPAQQFGTRVPIPPNYSVGFAAAEPSDPATLAAWPYGPVADEVEGFLDHRDELGPGVVGVGGDRFFLYYVDATHDDTGTSPPVEQIGRLGALGAGP